MRLINADAMIDRLKEWDTEDEVDKALYNFTLNRINEQPTVNVQLEITEEDVREWCYKRCLTIIDSTLYHEMRNRWSASADVIVHCKNCKYLNNLFDCWCYKWGTGVDADAFCNYGERKDGT